MEKFNVMVTAEIVVTAGSEKEAEEIVREQVKVLNGWKCGDYVRQDILQALDVMVVDLLSDDEIVAGEDVDQCRAHDHAPEGGDFSGPDVDDRDR